MGSHLREPFLQQMVMIMICYAHVEGTGWGRVSALLTRHEEGTLHMLLQVKKKTCKRPCQILASWDLRLGRAQVAHLDRQKLIYQVIP